ncbi:hypothetical protein MMC28_001667 [Mycoblastus sanguinarius]|nr:hypothetical protein [Mycoblastus sanguinarius]
MAPSQDQPKTSSSKDQPKTPSSKDQHEKSKKGSQSTIAVTKDDKNPSTDDKKKAANLRPSTPPAQAGSRNNLDGDLSPCSQACTSGTVTPNSEGVRRSDRNVWHQPPGGGTPPRRNPRDGANV